MSTTRAKQKPEQTADKLKSGRQSDSTQPMTQHGEESGQNSLGDIRFAEHVASLGGLRQPTPSTISTGTPQTIPPTTSRVYAKSVTTKKQQVKRDLEQLMQQHGIKWGKHEGKRVLYFPCSASEEGRRAVIEAIRNQ
jgi:hypothetical protein